jgi:ribonuclease HI
MKKPRLYIFTDGSGGGQSNPLAASWAFVVVSGGAVIQRTAGRLEGTAMLAEAMAVLQAIEWLKPAATADIFCDNHAVVNHLTNGRRQYGDLWAELLVRRMTRQVQIKHLDKKRSGGELLRHHRLAHSLCRAIKRPLAELPPEHRSTILDLYRPFKPRQLWRNTA